MSEYMEGAPFLEQIEQAALRHYQKQAEQNPVLHKFVEETAREVIPAFKVVMAEDYSIHSLDLYKGYYRILMDFCDKGPEEGKEIDLIHGSTIMGAFMFLSDKVFGRNWNEVTQEFKLLAVSLEAISNTYEIPSALTHDARFGFLFAMALENGTVTGLQRPKDQYKPQDLQD